MNGSTKRTWWFIVTTMSIMFLFANISPILGPCFIAYVIGSERLKQKVKNFIVPPKKYYLIAMAIGEGLFTLLLCLAVIYMVGVNKIIVIGGISYFAITYVLSYLCFRLGKAN